MPQPNDRVLHWRQWGTVACDGMRLRAAVASNLSLRANALVAGKAWQPVLPLSAQLCRAGAATAAAAAIVVDRCDAGARTAETDCRLRWIQCRSLRCAQPLLRGAATGSGERDRRGQCAVDCSAGQVIPLGDAGLYRTVLRSAVEDVEEFRIVLRRYMN